MDTVELSFSLSFNSTVKQSFLSAMRIETLVCRLYSINRMSIGFLFCCTFIGMFSEPGKGRWLVLSFFMLGDSFLFFFAKAAFILLFIVELSLLAMLSLFKL